MDTLNGFILSLQKTTPFRGELDCHLIRAVMAFTFFIFGYQKWFSLRLIRLRRLSSHSQLVFWLIPAFGVRGASFFLGTTEWSFGTLILLGFRYRSLGVVGVLGSTVTFQAPSSSSHFFPTHGRRKRVDFLGDVPSGGVPDEGFSFPGCFFLSSQAGSYPVAGAGDGAEYNTTVGQEGRIKIRVVGRSSWSTKPTVLSSR